jgi:hypothetical protein
VENASDFKDKNQRLSTSHLISCVCMADWIKVELGLCTSNRKSWTSKTVVRRTAWEENATSLGATGISCKTDS